MNYHYEGHYLKSFEPDSSIHWGQILRVLLKQQRTMRRHFFWPQKLHLFHETLGWLACLLFEKINFATESQQAGSCEMLIPIRDNNF